MIKQEEKKKIIIREPVALERKRIRTLMADSEETEFKLLDFEDIDDIASVLRKVAFEIGEKEKKQIKEILADKCSYGAYVDRLLVGLSLSWKICFNESTKSIYKCPEKNSIIIEEIAILVAYEGKGIREKLIELTEKAAYEKSLMYVVCVCGENPKEDNVIDVIKSRGTKLEKTLLQSGYSFFKGKYGLTAFKKLQ